MRNIFLTGLLVATILTPAAVSAADIKIGSAVPDTVLDGTDLADFDILEQLQDEAAQQRSRDGRRGFNRGNRNFNRRSSNNLGSRIRSSQREQRSQSRSARSRGERQRSRSTSRQNSRAVNETRREVRQSRRNANQARQNVREARRDASAANRNLRQDRRRFRKERRIAQNGGFARGSVRFDESNSRFDGRRGDGRRFDGRRGDGRRFDGRRGDGRKFDGRRGDRKYYNRGGRYYSKSDHRRWNRKWRSKKRYDWRKYRRYNSSFFSLGSYYSPFRYHRYSRFDIGHHLGFGFLSSRYWIHDPYRYRLPPAYGNYRWIRYYNDVALVDIYTGYVVDVVHGFFY